MMTKYWLLQLDIPSVAALRAVLSTTLEVKGANASTEAMIATTTMRDRIPCIVGLNNVFLMFNDVVVEKRGEDLCMLQGVFVFLFICSFSFLAIHFS